MAGGRYSISELAKTAGVSVRTLRYYDQIGLLSPLREENGYRSYGAAEAHKLQRIMRACGLSLADISQSVIRIPSTWLRCSMGIWMPFLPGWTSPPAPSKRQRGFYPDWRSSKL